MSIYITRCDRSERVYLLLNYAEEDSRVKAISSPRVKWGIGLVSGALHAANDITSPRAKHSYVSPPQSRTNVQQLTLVSYHIRLLSPPDNSFIEQAPFACLLPPTYTQKVQFPTRKYFGRRDGTG